MTFNEELCSPKFDLWIYIFQFWISTTGVFLPVFRKYILNTQNTDLCQVRLPPKCYTISGHIGRKENNSAYMEELDGKPKPRPQGVTATRVDYASKYSSTQPVELRAKLDISVPFHGYCTYNFNSILIYLPMTPCNCSNYRCNTRTHAHTHPEVSSLTFVELLSIMRNFAHLLIDQQ